VHTPGALHVPPFWHVGLHTAADAKHKNGTILTHGYNHMTVHTTGACTRKAREFMIVADLLHTMFLSSQ